jgi:hypothetical protein
MEGQRLISAQLTLTLVNMHMQYLSTCYLKEASLLFYIFKRDDLNSMENNP